MPTGKANKSSLWFIAVLPPEPILSEVKAFKVYARDHFDSGHALRSPAHITVFPPFRFPEKKLPDLETILNSFAVQQQSFKVELHDFNCFTPRTIYVDVILSPSLTKLQQSLKATLKTKLQLPYPGKHGYHPHMTIAFRDLSKKKFREAWDYFSKQAYQRTFSATAICLLKHHGAGWELYKTYSFDSLSELNTNEV